MSAHSLRPRRAFAVVCACLAWLSLATASASAASLPSAEADAVHTVTGEGKLSVFGIVSPNGGSVRYWFEFLNQAQFAEAAWAHAARTTAVETSAGGLISQQIPALPTGETYHYRLAVENEAAFNNEPQYSPTVRTLTVPTPEPETKPACPNEALRTGQSAKLPDCRAYEQVTPVNKEGADDIINYGNGFVAQTAIGLDGEHLNFEHTNARWGPDVGGTFLGQDTYSFSRDGATGQWKMTSLYPQPQTGGLSLASQVQRTFDTPDLSQVLVEKDLTVSNINHSRKVEYALGPPGGPYAVAGSDVYEGEGNEEEHTGHWVAQSRDGSVAVIESPDRELIPGKRTGTTMHHELNGGSAVLAWTFGFDLYAYSGGHTSQVNVYTNGETIGACGAMMVQGREGGGKRGAGQGEEIGSQSDFAGSVNAVSSNGSRIFFEADPSMSCPSREEEEQRDFDGAPGANIELYMRLNGDETVDIGNYTFEGANPEGTKLLLGKRVAGVLEYFSYDTETRTAKPLFSFQGDVLGRKHSLSEDGNVYYFEAIGNPLTPEAPANSDDIYRYDIPSETMRFIAVNAHTDSNTNGGFYASPDGRDFYFNVDSVQGVYSVHRVTTNEEVQVYRYDSAEDVVQCVSCASPFDPEPQLFSTFMPEFGPNNNMIAPLASPASENGNFVFFDSPSALVPQDINGEIDPKQSSESTPSEFYSPSSDVYEWRRYGVDGCGRVQGCLALITNGVDGTENVLLGVGRSNRDVFIGTHSQLAATDTDRSGDIYDVRIDGGFPPPPPRPTECEADACSTPPSAPSDPTQTLLPDVLAAETPVSTAPHTTTKPKVTKCAKGRVRSHGKCVKRKGKSKTTRARGKAKRSSSRASLR
jgi:hypothetical protein